MFSDLHNRKTITVNLPDPLASLCHPLSVISCITRGSHTSKTCSLIIIILQWINTVPCSSSYNPGLPTNLFEHRGQPLRVTRLIALSPQLLKPVAVLWYEEGSVYEILTLPLEHSLTEYSDDHQSFSGPIAYKLHVAVTWHSLFYLFTYHWSITPCLPTQQYCHHENHY